MTKLQKTRPSDKTSGHSRFGIRHKKNGADVAGAGTNLPQTASSGWGCPSNGQHWDDPTHNVQENTKPAAKSAWQRLNRLFEAPRNKVTFLIQKPRQHHQTAAQLSQDTQQHVAGDARMRKLNIDNIERTAAKQTRATPAILEAKRVDENRSSREQQIKNIATESIPQQECLGENSDQRGTPEKTVIDLREEAEKSVKVALALRDVEWQKQLEAREQEHKEELEEQSRCARQIIDFWRQELSKAKEETEDVEKRHKKEVDRLRFYLGLRKAAFILLGKKRRDELAARDKELDNKEAIVSFLHTQTEQRVRDCQIAGIKLAAVDRHEQALHDEHAKYVECANATFQEIERRCRELIASYEQEQQKGIQVSQNYMELIRQHEGLVQELQQQREEKNLMEKHVNDLVSMVNEQTNQIHSLKSQLASMAQPSPRSAIPEHPPPNSTRLFLSETRGIGHGENGRQGKPRAQRPFKHFGQAPSGQQTPFSFSNQAHTSGQLAQYPQGIFNSSNQPSGATVQGGNWDKPSSTFSTPADSSSSRPNQRSRFANMFSEQEDRG